MSTVNKHTQGEWFIDVRDKEGENVYINCNSTKNNEAEICQMNLYVNGGLLNKNEMLANAQLIVKAVNNHSLLIEALKEVINDDKVNAILLGSTRAKIKGILNSIEQ